MSAKEVGPLIPFLATNCIGFGFLQSKKNSRKSNPVKKHASKPAPLEGPIRNIFRSCGVLTTVSCFLSFAEQCRAMPMCKTWQQAVFSCAVLWKSIDLRFVKEDLTADIVAAMVRRAGMQLTSLQLDGLTRLSGVKDCKKVFDAISAGAKIQVLSLRGLHGVRQADLLKLCKRTTIHNLLLTYPEQFDLQLAEKLAENNCCVNGLRKLHCKGW
jgi:hypothetical protein